MKEEKRGQKKRGGGPRTAIGKVIASRNSAKVGIFASLPTLRAKFKHDAEYYEQALAGLQEEFSPETFSSIHACHELAIAYTRLRRVQIAELALIESLGQEQIGKQDYARVTSRTDPHTHERILDSLNVTTKRFKLAQELFQALTIDDPITSDLVVDHLVIQAETLGVNVSEILGCWTEAASMEKKQQHAREIFEQMCLRLAGECNPKRSDPELRQFGWNYLRGEARKELEDASNLYQVRLHERELTLITAFFSDEKASARICKYERHLTRRINELRVQLRNSKSN